MFAAGGVKVAGPAYSGKANCWTCWTKPAGGSGASGAKGMTRTAGEPGDAAGCGTSRKESNRGVRGVDDVMVGGAYGDASYGT